MSWAECGGLSEVEKECEGVPVMHLLQKSKIVMVSIVI